MQRDVWTMRQAYLVARPGQNVTENSLSIDFVEAYAGDASLMIAQEWGGLTIVPAGVTNLREILCDAREKIARLNRLSHHTYEAGGEANSVQLQKC